MKILRVARTVYPDVKGGVPYHVHAMSREQAAVGHEVTVLTVRSAPELPHLEERDRYTIVRYAPSTTLLGNDLSAGVARYLGAAEDIDVLHAHSHLYFSTNLAALKRRLDGVPLAITNHGLFSQTAPKWLFDLYLRTLGRWAFNRGDVIFCYTDVDKRRLRAYSVRTAIEIVSNGVNTDRFTPAGPTNETVESDQPVLLFVGRLVDGKRPQDAIHVLNAVRDAYPDAILSICGDGPLRSDLEALAALLGIRENVQFLGHVPYDQMPKIYRSADVLLLHSRSEGVPRSVLEAFASGVPAVTSELPQSTEIVAAGGSAVPVGDIDGFTAAVENLLSDPARQSTLGTQGREYVDRHARWEATVEATTDRLARLTNHRE